MHDHNNAHEATKRSDTPRRVSTSELSSDLRVAVGRLNRRVRAEKADGDLSDGQFAVLACCSARVRTPSARSATTSGSHRRR